MVNKMVNVTKQIDEQTDEKDTATNQPATDVSITSTNTLNDPCKYIYRSPVLFLSPNITERRDFMEKRFGLVSMRFNNRYSDQNTIIEDIKKKDEFKDKKFILLGMDHVKKMSLTDLVEILFICLDCELNDENKNVMKMKKDGDVPAIYLVKEILPEFVDCDQFIICDGCRDITMLWKSFDKRYLKSAFRSIYQLSDTVNVKPEIFDIISDFIIQAIVYCCMMVDDQVDEFRDYYLAQSLSRITRYIKYDILINGLLDSITEMLRAITISEMARFFNPEEDTSDEEK